MARIGVTGHREIPGAALERVRAGMRAEFRHRTGSAVPAEVLSSLAAGADQLFADIALDCGVPVTAVIPGVTAYAETLGGDEARLAYHRLLTACARTVVLPPARTDDEAYEAAGRWIVDHADRMVAVWDGCPARGPGGTGDIVAYARRSGVPVAVLWSPGVRRA